MDITVSRVDALREYVFDYVTGVLWLLSLAAWYAASGQGAQVRDGVRAAGAMLPAGAGAEFFTAFLLLIGGVIVPYAISMAFRPITWIIMNFVLRVQVAWMTVVLKRDPVENELRRKAADIVRGVLGIRGEPTQDMLRLYLGSTDAAVARRVQQAHDHVRFQSLSLLPSSLFLALLAQNLISDAVGASAFVTFFVVFVLGARASNKALFLLGNTLEMAVILAAARTGDSRVEGPEG